MPSSTPAFHAPNATPTTTSTPTIARAIVHPRRTCGPPSARRPPSMTSLGLRCEAVVKAMRRCRAARARRAVLRSGAGERDGGSGVVIRLVPVVIGALLVVLVLTVIADGRRSRRMRATGLPPRPPRTPILAPKQRDYDWERR